MDKTSKGIVTPVDVYDADGNMTKIEGINSAGDVVIDALWDPRDKQTNDNRVKFRVWAYRMLNQMGYEVKT